ncbi:hypothetical protein PROFUN_06421 [Planoprotostelium fungivorum]|uniref:RNB domain-containing protein n=1 Tax=Planoprotostelium fungivorum TaxID=1890364 RepID=A0A2P6NNV7_9EUKA|nr:hypothetical protein PROFUN_06421 [Planoprotostelium fungivorum]
MAKVSQKVPSLDLDLYNLLSQEPVKEKAVTDSQVTSLGQKPQLEVDTWVLLIRHGGLTLALVRRVSKTYAHIQVPGGTVHHGKYVMNEKVRESHAQIVAELSRSSMENRIRKLKRLNPDFEYKEDMVLPVDTNTFPIFDQDLFGPILPIFHEAKTKSIVVPKTLLRNVWKEMLEGGKSMTVSQFSERIFPKQSHNHIHICAAARILAQNADLFRPVESQAANEPTYRASQEKYVESRRLQRMAMHEKASMSAFQQAVFARLKSLPARRFKFWRLGGPSSRLPIDVQKMMRQDIEERIAARESAAEGGVEEDTDAEIRYDGPGVVPFHVEEHRVIVDALMTIVLMSTREAYDPVIADSVQEWLCVSSLGRMSSLMMDLGVIDTTTDLNKLSMQKETNFWEPPPEGLMESIHGQIAKMEAGPRFVDQKKPPVQLTQKNGPWNFPMVITDPHEKNRAEGLFGRCIFTVDSDSTIEVDDAISSTDDGWVHIHIADPTRMIQPKSSLDLWARSRGTSLYNVDEWVSMLPLELAAGPMSLYHTDQKNPSITFSAKLNPDGSINQSQIQLSTINNLIRANYEQVERALSLSEGERGNQSLPSHLTEQSAGELNRIYQHALKRKKYRQERNVRFHHVPKVTPLVEDGRVVGFHTDDQVLCDKATTMVSEMMILAGEIVYHFSQKHGIPVPYRVQEKPTHIYDPSEISVENPHKGMLNLLRSIETMSSAYNSTENIGHHSIGLEGYVRTTSPIRRYMDCLVHYQLKAHLTDAPPPFSKEELDNIIPLVNMSEHLAKQLQQRSARFWLRQYLRDRVGEDFLSFVVSTELDVIDRLQVYIPELGLRSVIEHWSAPLGTEVIVRLMGITPYSATFVTSLVSVSKYKSNPKKVNPNIPKIPLL